MWQIDERLEICNIYILDFFVNLFSVLWVPAKLTEYSDQSNCCWLTVLWSALSVLITLAGLVHLLPSSHNSQQAVSCCPVPLLILRESMSFGILLHQVVGQVLRLAGATIFEPVAHLRLAPRHRVKPIFQNADSRSQLESNLDEPWH